MSKSEISIIKYVNLTNLRSSLRGVNNDLLKVWSFLLTQIRSGFSCKSFRRDDFSLLFLCITDLILVSFFIRCIVFDVTFKELIKCFCLHYVLSHVSELICQFPFSDFEFGGFRTVLPSRVLD